MKQVAFAILAAVTLLFVSCGNDYPTRMPDIELTDMYGNNVSASELAKPGKPVMLSFYATWCDPCTKELNKILPLYKKWQKEYGVELIIVSIDKYPAQISAVVETIKDHGWQDFGLLFDSEGKLMRNLELETIPTMFFVDGKGNITHRTVGYDKDSVSDAENYLREITLAAKKAPAAK